jgi:hypothetical protein
MGRLIHFFVKKMKRKKEGKGRGGQGRHGCQKCVQTMRQKPNPDHAEGEGTGDLSQVVTVISIHALKSLKFLTSDG